MLIKPTISDAVFAMRPDYAALSICADGIINHLTTEPVSGHSSHPWTESHLSAWQDAYRAFGAKPQRTPNSADALRSRVERNGSVPPINAIVDLYNAVTLTSLYPAVTTMLAVFVLRERLTVAQRCGLFMAGVAAIAITQNS